MANKFPRWLLIREILTSYSLRCSDIRMAPTLSAEFFGPPTAETIGQARYSSRGRRKSSTLKSIPAVLQMLCWSGQTTVFSARRMGGTATRK